MAEYKISNISLTITLADSTALPIDNDDIILGSLSVSEASSGANEFEIGTAISKKLSFQIKNYNSEYNAYDFGDATITGTITVTVVDATTTTESLPVGVFHIVDKPNYNGGVISIEALDSLYLLARDYTTALTFPATLLQIYEELCTNCGLVPSQASIPNGAYIVTDKPDLEAMTAANMLCHIAQISGTFAQMTPYGYLELKTYGGTTHSLSDTYSIEVDTDDVVITGVRVTEYFDETDDLKRQTVLNGTAAYALDIKDNPLIQSGDAQTVADFLSAIYAGMQFRPYKITIPKDPTIHVGDTITLTDYKGNTYNSYVTEVTFSTDSPTSVQMNAASPQRNSAVRYSAQAKALAEAKRLIDNEKTSRELAVDAMARQIANASGMYETAVAQSGGGYIYYLHDKSTLATSTIVVRVDSTGVYFSTDGGATYTNGLDYSGNAILNKVYAIGINADYINAGTITGRAINNGSGTFTVDTSGNVVANSLSSNNANITGGRINIRSSTETADVIELTYSNGTINNTTSISNGSISTSWRDDGSALLRGGILALWNGDSSGYYTRLAYDGYTLYDDAHAVRVRLVCDSTNGAELTLRRTNQIPVTSLSESGLKIFDETTYAREKVLIGSETNGGKITLSNTDNGKTVLATLDASGTSGVLEMFGDALETGGIIRLYHYNSRTNARAVLTGQPTNGGLLTIYHSSANVAARLQSDSAGGVLRLYTSSELQQVRLSGAEENGGNLYLYNTSYTGSAVVTATLNGGGSTSYPGGSLNLYNGDAKRLVLLNAGALSSGGGLTLYNTTLDSDNKPYSVVYVGATASQNGQVLVRNASGTSRVNMNAGNSNALILYNSSGAVTDQYGGDAVSYTDITLSVTPSSFSKGIRKYGRLAQMHMYIALSSATTATTDITVTLPSEVKSVAERRFPVLRGTSPYPVVGSMMINNSTTAHIYLQSGVSSFVCNGVWLTPAT